MLATVGCNKPKVIPDNTLGRIFHDAMLTNSYIKNVMVDADSLNIYEPILANYGYTNEDLQYTLVNFSRRKSARLGDVAEHMIILLEREAMLLEHKVAILDTIDNVARRQFTRVLLDKSDIKATTEADSTLLHFEIPILGAGDYRIECRYTLDSLDKTEGRRYRFEWMHQDSSVRVAGANSLYQGVEREINQTYSIREKETNIAIILSFNHVQERIQRKGRPSTVKNRRDTPRMTINELKVTYVPDAKSSVEELYRKQLNARVLSDTLIRYIEAKAR